MNLLISEDRSCSGIVRNTLPLASKGLSGHFDNRVRTTGNRPPRHAKLSSVELAVVDDAIVIAIKILENEARVCGRPGNRWCRDSDSEARTD